MLNGRVYDDVNNVVMDGTASGNGNGDRDMEDEILTTDELSSGVNEGMTAEQQKQLCYDCAKYEKKYDKLKRNHFCEKLQHAVDIDELENELNERQLNEEEYQLNNDELLQECQTLKDEKESLING